MHPVDVAVLVPASRLWTAWTFDPAVIASIVLVAALYARGLSTLAGKRPGGRPSVIRPRQAWSFYAGLGLLGVALVSPLDALSGTLLSAHMAQHLILILMAPPLLVYGRPGLVLMMGLPRNVRSKLREIEWDWGLQPLVRASRNPLLVLGGVLVSMWAWHLPPLYDAAIANPVVHAAEHLSFLVTALAFWRLIIDGSPRRRLSYPAAIPLTFAVMLGSAALGAAITLSPHVLYPVYRAGASMWGISALGDQQLAGALMWIPPGGVYLITMLVLARRWFAQVELHTRASSVPMSRPVMVPVPPVRRSV
jgi:putative membrane protein